MVVEVDHVLLCEFLKSRSINIGCKFVSTLLMSEDCGWHTLQEVIGITINMIPKPVIFR